MGESIFTRKGGGVELTGNATTGDVLLGQTFYSDNASNKLTGTLSLTGNATAGVVFSGYTFYSTDAKTKLTGTFAFTGNATTADVSSGKTFYATNGTKLTGTGSLVGDTGIDFSVIGNIDNGRIGWVNSISVRGDSVYTGGTSTDQRLKRFDKNNFALLANTVNLTGGITKIKSPPNSAWVYYATNGGNGNISRATNTDLAVFHSTNSYGGIINDFDIVSDRILVGGATNQAIKQWYGSDLSSLTYYAVTNSYGSDIYAVRADLNHIFVGGDGGQIKKWHLGNMNYNQASNGYGGTIMSLDIDDEFVYAVGFTSRRLKKWYKSNLVFVGESAQWPVDMDGRQVIVDDNYAYVTGYAGRVHKYHKGNLVFINNSASFTNAEAQAMVKDDDYIYIGGRNFTGNRVVKLIDGKEFANVGGIRYYKL